MMDAQTKLLLCDLRIERARAYQRLLAKRSENTEMLERIARNDAVIASEQRRQVQVDKEIAKIELQELIARREALANKKEWK